MNAKTVKSETKPTTSRAVRKSAPTSATKKRLPVAVATATARKSPAKKSVQTATPSVAVEMPAAVVPVRDSKQARLIAMLRAEPGATINQMMSLTGWQAHTVRGTLSGVLRKKLKLIVACESATDSGEHLYRIVGSADVV